MNTKIKSIKDIAKVLNISTSTVSRVLNKSGYYSKDVEEKILALVEESGFIFNMSAKSLRSSKTNTIGLMLPDISSAYFSSLAFSIEEYLNKVGYSVLICNTMANPESEYNHFKTLAANKVDGIICVSQMTKMPTNYQNHNIPIVAIDRYPLCEMPITKVVTDDYTMSFQIAEMLVEKGCKDIVLMIGKDDNIVVTDISISRVSGFIDGLKKHGITLKEQAILRPSISKDNSVFEAEAAINTLISNNIKFDAVFAISDRLALGVVYALNNAGISVPEKVKVVGYDNTIYSMFSRPSISSIDRNIDLMASQACEKLCELINSDDKVDDSKITIPSFFVERESTK
jgi:LacI family transcriptional regulator